MMLVKTQHNLQPTILPAHSVIIEDDVGNPLFVAVALDEKTVVCAQAHEPDFHALLRSLGMHKTTLVRQEQPVPVQKIVRTL